MDEALKAATGRVGSLLNEATPIQRLPPELFTRILSFVVDHGSREHFKQIIPLTHVCRYWRTSLLTYPKMWSTLCMRPGPEDPSVISEWLARSQSIPLTVIAELSDAYEHPVCRYHDAPTATIDDPDAHAVCPRHEAVLSLNQLLPHRSRIRDLDVSLHFSDPDWHAYNEPPLLHHLFFRETLPNLQRLDFRATHVEFSDNAIPVLDPLFVGRLPRLKDLKYLGVDGGLMRTVENLDSCEIGFWSGSAGISSIPAIELHTLLNNNKKLRSLTANRVEFMAFDDPWVPAAIPMTNLKFLKLGYVISRDLQVFCSCIEAPQFRSLDTLQLSLLSHSFQGMATDGSGHTFEFSQAGWDDLVSQPLQFFGAEITTLRLDQIAPLRPRDRPLLHQLLISLGAVRALEFNKTCLEGGVLSDLSIAGILPRLKVIRVTIPRNCRETLQLFAAVAKLRMEEGNPLATIEPLLAEGEDGLGQELRAEWEKYSETEGIQHFLSE